MRTSMCLDLTVTNRPAVRVHAASDEEEEEEEENDHVEGGGGMAEGRRNNADDDWLDIGGKAGSYCSMGASSEGRAAEGESVYPSASMEHQCCNGVIQRSSTEPNLSLAALSDRSLAASTASVLLNPSSSEANLCLARPSPVAYPQVKLLVDTC